MKQMNKIAKKLKNIGLAALVAGAMTLPTKSYGQTPTLKVNYIHPVTTEDTRVRPEMTYGLPDDVKGYTFIDFYTQHEDYFAKTFLSKEVVGGLEATLEVIQGNNFTDQVGIGTKYNLPLGENAYGNVKLLPVYVDMGGEFQKDKVVTGFLVGTTVYVPVVGDVDICAFGEINLAAKGGPQWQYGELSVTKDLGNVEFGLSVDLNGKGKLLPQAAPGLKILHVFGDQSKN